LKIEHQKFTLVAKFLQQFMTRLATSFDLLASRMQVNVQIKKKDVSLSSDGSTVSDLSFSFALKLL